MTIITRQYVDDNDLVARYLADKLPAREREEFEAFVINDPELLRELDRTAQFKSGLMSLQRSGKLQTLVKGKPWWHRSGPIALAASLILVVAGATLLLRRTEGPKPIIAASARVLATQKGIQAISGPYSIQRTRSSSYDATITYPANGAPIALRIKPEAVASPARYRIALSIFSGDNRAQPVATVSNLEPETDGFIPVYLNSAAITPAVYELKISGDAGTSGENTESSFLVEIIRTP